MNTFQLSCFLAVAETLSFARAAEQLSITQPAVTHQIHSLETELNVKLFVRTTRTVNLTQEGTLFLNDARNILALTIRATKRFENPLEQEIQLFSIGCHSYSHMFLLADVLRLSNGASGASRRAVPAALPSSGGGRGGYGHRISGA
ncbi:LysR family transcriptional regulator [Hungatella effluvii]|uniref:LysR family transcriptional regulator n=1 Tax=Hungatella effluvii TaxID=1096246 RepID=UPI002A80F090|nr:LysR family transcriptional regulator [Hungatella effluvii]